MPTGLEVRFRAISTVVLCDATAVMIVPLKSVRLRLLLLPGFLLAVLPGAELMLLLPWPHVSHHVVLVLFVPSLKAYVPACLLLLQTGCRCVEFIWVCLACSVLALCCMCSTWRATGGA